jgi:hypothetical protein
MNAEELLELNIKLEKLLDKKYEIIKQQADEIKELKNKFQQEFEYAEKLLKDKQ